MYPECIVQRAKDAVHICRFYLRRRGRATSFASILDSQYADAHGCAACRVTGFIAAPRENPQVQERMVDVYALLSDGTVLGRGYRAICDRKATHLIHGRFEAALCGHRFADLRGIGHLAYLRTRADDLASAAIGYTLLRVVQGISAKSMPDQTLR